MTQPTGQPDWQRFQSSAGPALYTAAGASPLASGTIFTGPWRSWYMAATVTAGTGVWQITADFATDKLFTNIVATTVSVVAAGIKRIGWQPIVAQYMRITTILTVASAGDTISVKVAPSLLDAPQASRIITAPFIDAYELGLLKGSSNNLDATYSMPGPAILTVRTNVYDVVYDLEQRESTGLFTQLMRYQLDGYNQAYQYNVLLPDQPIRLVVFNASLHAFATYDLILSPA